MSETWRNRAFIYSMNHLPESWLVLGGGLGQVVTRLEFPHEHRQSQSQKSSLTFKVSYLPDLSRVRNFERYIALSVGSMSSLSP